MSAADVALVRSALRRFGRAVIRVEGLSMLPTIAPGSTVELREHPYARVTVGQVVAYESDGDIVVHRVVRTGPGELYAAGDARPRVDPPVERAGFLGLAAAYPVVAPEPFRPEDHTGTGTGPPSVRLWVFDDAAPAGGRITVTRLPRPGMGAAEADIARLRAETRDSDLRIGVCQSARHPAEVLTSLDWARYGRVDVHAGVGTTTAAPPLPDGTRLLPEGLADLFVRTAPLDARPDTAEVAAALLPLLHRCLDTAARRARR